MDLNGIVGTRVASRWFSRDRVSENVGLHRAEARFGRRAITGHVLNGLDPGALAKQRLQVADRPRPSRQQFVVLVVVAAQVGSRSLGPEVTARAEQKQVYVHDRGGQAKHFQIGRGHCRDAEEAHPRPGLASAGVLRGLKGIPVSSDGIDPMQGGGLVGDQGGP